MVRCIRLILRFSLTTLTIPPVEHKLYLSRNGLEYYKRGVVACVRHSFEAFVSIVNLGQDEEIARATYPYEKVYAISREIPTGGVERFHIIVGASRSCSLKVRFKFYT